LNPSGLARHGGRDFNDGTGSESRGPESSEPEKNEEVRPLVTLAIETSCDDTCVAILEKRGPRAMLLLNDKFTSDNRKFGGVEPITAVESHTANLARIVQIATLALPRDRRRQQRPADIESVPPGRPDFVSVTRGPGMTASLSVGLNMAKGLAVAWGVPLVGVHHMQAHALTPRLVRALKPPSFNEERGEFDPRPSPSFPFLSLLVSGGHTQLLLSRSVTSHAILAEAHNAAVGDMLDKCARAILPPEVLASAEDVMYGAQLESFAFSVKRNDKRNDKRTSKSLSPEFVDPYEHKYGYVYNPPAKRADEIKPYISANGWFLTPPLSERRDMAYDFSGLGGQVQAIMQKNPDMDVPQRQELAREAMRLVFEHLASRAIFALDDLRANEKKKGREQQQQQQQQQPQQQDPTVATTTTTPGVTTLVVSGGVASNRFLRYILKRMLSARGYPDLEILFPPPHLCTDNAAMIAWAGMEMYEAGWHTDLSALPVRKWSMDDGGGDDDAGVDSKEQGGGGEGGERKGGILGMKGWLRLPEPEPEPETTEETVAMERGPGPGILGGVPKRWSRVWIDGER
jgi:glycoprotease/Kae1 family metallohydrolase